MKLGEARLTDGLRIYSIGDVHGCDDMLAAMHEKIADDLAARPCATHRIIHIGDYVDRGPDNAGVIERLSRLGEADDRILCLRGNHEEMLLDFLDDPLAIGDVWLRNGGDATLASYGLDVELAGVTDRAFEGLGAAFAASLPSRHRVFLEGLPYWVQFGDYFFCHAGVRPGIAIEEQDRFDLIWIREEFLYSDDDFGAVVVHGHTPADEPEIGSNRINIDTGAVYGGALTCVVLEGRDHHFLDVQK